MALSAAQPELFLAIFVAVAGCVLISALIRGYQHDMLDDAGENLTGNLKVMAPGYRADPSIARGFELNESFVRIFPRIRCSVGRSECACRRSCCRNARHAASRCSASTPQTNARFRSRQRCDSGRGVDRCRRPSLAVGRRTRDAIEYGRGPSRGRDEPGRRRSQPRSGISGRRALRRIGHRARKTYAFTGLHHLQKLLGTQAVTEVSVRLRDDRYTAMAERALASEMDGLEVLSWRELEPQAAAMFEVADVGIFIWLTRPDAALAFGLINTLMTAVLERVREFGMLRALGMRPAPSSFRSSSSRY